MHHLAETHRIYNLNDNHSQESFAQGVVRCATYIHEILTESGPKLFLDRFPEILDEAWMLTGNPNPPTEPYVSNSGAFNNAIGTTIDVTTPFRPPWDETKQCVVFVHGWYTDYNGFCDYSETFYKRLWWQGYKGRFIGFNWPALTSPQTFNSSEWIAWLYGGAFMNFVTSIQGSYSRLTVAGHSQGNVVVGSAIQEGLKISNYIMLQAAIPTGCYTTTDPSDDQYNNYKKFKDAELITSTPNFASSLGYRNFITPNKWNVGQYYCFYNTNDYALATGSKLGKSVSWEANEVDYKPDGSPGQTILGAYTIRNSMPDYDQVFEGLTISHRTITEPHESMSFVARPRSQAAGADPNSASVFKNATDLSQPPYNFTGAANDHSGQFQRDYYLVYKLYQQFKTIIAPQ